jgi:hypothetical protein
MAKARFDVDLWIARDGAARGAAEPADLVKGLRGIAGHEELPPGVKRPAGMLADALLHGEDIRRPLGQTRVAPEERVVATLRELEDYKSAAVNVRRRIAGLRLEATDVEWAVGDGPAARGPGVALAMVMGGRGAALADLEGEGVAVLTERIGKESPARVA